MGGNQTFRDPSTPLFTFMCFTNGARTNRSGVHAVPGRPAVSLSFFNQSFEFFLVGEFWFKWTKFLLDFHRNSEKSQRSQLDLCVVLFRTRNPANPEVGRLVEHSKRQVAPSKRFFWHFFLTNFPFNRCAALLEPTKCWNVIFTFSFVWRSITGTPASKILCCSPNVYLQFTALSD